MASAPLTAFARPFASLQDPRHPRTRKHPWTKVLVIGLGAVIAGAKHFTPMEAFGLAKRDGLATVLDLRNGLPSPDVFNAVCARLLPETFERAWLRWVTALPAIRDGPILALDGQTLRGSYRPGDSKALIHRVSVGATAHPLSLGSPVVDAKSNEITAIPRLRELIDVSGGLVTIDARGGQQAIAPKILDAPADYVLPVKDHQPIRNEAIGASFGHHGEADFRDGWCAPYHTEETGHGRREARWSYVLEVGEAFGPREDWPGLQAVGVVVRNTQRQGQDGWDVRHYLWSTKLSGARFGEAVRGPGGIENNGHGQLEVPCREDDRRVYQGHAPTNLSIVIRVALGLLKNDRSVRGGIETQRLRAGWDQQYLEKILTTKEDKTR